MNACAVDVEDNEFTSQVSSGSLKVCCMDLKKTRRSRLWS
jgi:hypothetical protein